MSAFSIEGSTFQEGDSIRINLRFGSFASQSIPSSGIYKVYIRGGVSISSSSPALMSDNDGLYIPIKYTRNSSGERVGSGSIQIAEMPGIQGSRKIYFGAATETLGSVSATVTDRDVNDSIRNDTFLIAENSATGTPIGYVTKSIATDTPINFSISRGNLDVDGDGAKAFEIDPLSGLIFVGDSSDINFENTSSIQLSVLGSWGANNSLASITINLSDANDSPTGTLEIIGLPSQGQLLEVSNGLYDEDIRYGFDSGYPISFTWRADDVVVGANRVYTLKQSDVGKRISVTGSYSDRHGSQSVVSNGTQPISNINDPPLGVVTISGTFITGQPLVASNSITDLDGMGDVSYTWIVDDSIVGSGKSYTPDSLDTGRGIAVLASYVDGYGSRESITSGRFRIKMKEPVNGIYGLEKSNDFTSEGATATFTISTTNVTAGTAVPYTISGVSASDVVGGQLSGTVNVGTNGQATISVPLVADLFTEGTETLTVTAGGQVASITVLDTSTSPLIPTYSLSASSASVAEGGVAVFNLATTNIAAGNSVNYLISGISEADVVGGILSGSAIVDTNGRATISVPIAADSLTEDTETLRVIVSDKAATMSIADTSVATTTNTTNITNNITNNVTNNTTNNIAGSVNNTTNNFINSFNRTLKVYDASVTNDVKVVVTRIGDITRIEGNQENNTLVGTDAIDRLVGGGGSDRFYSSKGNDVLDGGDGTDAVTYQGTTSDFRVEKVGSNWLVRDTRTDSSINEGEDTLIGVERVAFQNKVLALDTDGTAGKAYRVYKAAFNRDPMQGDTSGLGYWIGQMDSAMDLIEVSARFVDSKEFRDLYGTNPTNAQFLTKLYQNVLGRAPEATGYNWWLNELNTNPSKTKAKVLADFSESGENQTGVAALIGNGIAYEPWVG